MHILDCTIRDGGYVIKNHWAPDILKKAVSALSSAGIRYIEIGVGLGLGAYRRTKDTLSDEDYMRLCLPHRGDSLIGMFFIPGIGTRDDLKRFRDNGGDFVRVGANANVIDTAFEWVEYAKTLGFHVSCNLMKTYAISKYRLARFADGVVGAGADCIYIVDSAGGMLPNQVAEYVKAIKQFYQISVGFHGHNNLLLANANSLAALQAGADFVDATLLGIGRGAGNAQLESLIAICQKARLLPNSCNVLQLADKAEEIVGNLMPKGSTKREINVGMANFHDSFTDLLEHASAKYGVDPDIVMKEVCKINVINPSEELFDLVARRLKEGTPFEFIPAYSHKKY